MTWHWLAFDCTAFDWPFVCAEDIQCLLWIYVIFIRRFLCMFSIFNSLIKQFHGFLSQAVLLNLLREILSKTQNEEPPQVVFYVSNNTSKFINYTRYFRSMGSLKRLFRSNEKGGESNLNQFRHSLLEKSYSDQTFSWLEKSGTKMNRDAGPKLV